MCLSVSMGHLILLASSFVTVLSDLNSFPNRAALFEHRFVQYMVQPSPFGFSKGNLTSTSLLNLMGQKIEERQDHSSDNLCVFLSQSSILRPLCQSGVRYWKWISLRQTSVMNNHVFVIVTSFNEKY